MLYLCCLQQLTICSLHSVLHRGCRFGFQIGVWKYMRLAFSIVKVLRFLFCCGSFVGFLPVEPFVNCCHCCESCCKTETKNKEFHELIIKKPVQSELPGWLYVKCWESESSATQLSCSNTFTSTFFASLLGTHSVSNPCWIDASMLSISILAPTVK